ncbi:alkaline phosphatase [Psychrosphaera sp. F3M07]|uniref:alkaline phosphatase n=1 Tax=Psychrosphaera sp. F3M07 TaxID=2841560 RepID=UPI001C0A02B2|nr:alkaline phosphatase [Psychrosphaera sp. F3M07]MBU2917036.1 alkaline phosphatase [Psychrosphaera sp. F3M07]
MKLTKLFTFISTSILLTACSTQEVADNKTEKLPKNIIYMIGDGMSMAHLTAYRHYVNSSEQHVGLGNKVVPQTVFDKYFVGVASTLPDDDTLVTDSASSATALASGEKTYNGAIGLDNDKSTLTSILEHAKTKGMLTGTISTSQITHATPASFLAHNESRNNQNEIADAILDQHINNKVKADLLLGGGTDYFIRDDRNLVDEFKQLGFSYYSELSQLNKMTQLPVLGLFAPKGLPYAIDSQDNPNRLLAMTKPALSLLNKNNPNGFFLMIEGSQIDWCSHSNDIACAMQEMEDFAQTLSAVIEFAKKDGNTLVVLTADHGTGGLSVGANKQYKWLPNVVHKVKASAGELVKSIFASKNIAKTWLDSTGFELTSEQLTLVKELKAQDKSKELYGQVMKLINDQSFTGWTTTGHVGDDVAVIAYGPQSNKFVGAQDNTDLAKKLLSYIKTK